MKRSIEEIRNDLFYGKRIFDIPLRVTFYGRVSTDDDKQLYSLEHQAAYFESKIKGCPQWEYIPGYIDEGISGVRADKRPRFLSMVRDAKAGRFDLILTKEVSRFARDIVDCVQTVRELLRYNVGVLIEDINLNTMDKDAEFHLSIMAIVAQEESRKTSERVKFGFRQTFKEGKRHGATAPIGYRFCDENNGYIIDESKAAVVDFVFNEYAKGELGTRRIAEALASHGYLNDRGNPYNPTTIERMIRNPVYKGYIVNGKSYKPSYREDRKIEIPRSEWLLHYAPERVPPLVSDAIWDKANKVLAIRRKKLEGADCKSTDALGNGRYTYSNRIFCGEHGCSYHRTSSRWYVNGEKRSAEYWRCSLYKKYGRKHCDAPLLYKRELDAVMRKLFSPIVPMLHEACKPLSGLIQHSIIAEQSIDVSELERRQAALERKKKKLLDGWINGIVSDNDYKAAYSKISQQQSELQTAVLEADNACTEADTSKQVLKVMRQAFCNANLETEEAIGRLVRAFVKKIIVKRKPADAFPDNRPYILEIWLFGSETPIKYNLSQRNQSQSLPPDAVTLPNASPCRITE